MPSEILVKIPTATQLINILQRSSASINNNLRSQISSTSMASLAGQLLSISHADIIKTFCTTINYLNVLNINDLEKLIALLADNDNAKALGKAFVLKAFVLKALQHAYVLAVWDAYFKSEDHILSSSPKHRQFAQERREAQRKQITQLAAEVQTQAAANNQLMILLAKTSSHSDTKAAASDAIQPEKSPASFNTNSALLAGAQAALNEAHLKTTTSASKVKESEKSSSKKPKKKSSSAKTTQTASDVFQKFWIVKLTELKNTQHADRQEQIQQLIDASRATPQSKQAAVAQARSALATMAVVLNKPRDDFGMWCKTNIFSFMYPKGTADQTDTYVKVNNILSAFEVEANDGFTPADTLTA